MTVGTHITHNTHAAGIGENSKILAGDVFDRIAFQFTAEDPVGFPQDLQLLPGNSTDDPDCQTGAGEGLAEYLFLRNP